MRLVDTPEPSMERPETERFDGDHHDKARI